MRVYEFLHWYYSHKLWCKLYLYLSHLLNQFFKFRFILYKRIWSILPISHHCTPFKILLICSARYFHAKPWSMDEGLLGHFICMFPSVCKSMSNNLLFLHVGHATGIMSTFCMLASFSRKPAKGKVKADQIFQQQ